ncbi:hypothetical protein [Micromonospora wenchangensis]|uniref:hypothetical protein n=1 Tax=Micromonospora wenchangensis TaxID=1185415 RepID=UPI00341F574C
MSAAVTRAASVLGEESDAGIDNARRLRGELTADRRVDPAAFGEMAGRIRRNPHALTDTGV